MENIRFSGGEPTLHPNIVEVIQYSKDKQIQRIAISTNGSQSLDLYKKLIESGVNDFSISLDACCAEDGDKMSGSIKGSWDIVIKNIEEISKLTYVTVGIVLIQDNIDKTIDTIRLSHKLGVSDIRIISAAQYNETIPRLKEVEQEIIDKYPILKFRIQNFLENKNVRGMSENDFNHCALMLDDSIIAGDYHYPCVIAMREGSLPVGIVGRNMRAERRRWFENHDTFQNSICRKNCLDVCISYNNRYRELKSFK